MLLKKLTLLFTLILVLSLIPKSFAQENKSDFNPLGGTFGVLLDGGLVWPMTDYKNAIQIPMVRGGLEYFFPTGSMHAFGLRAMVGYNTYKGDRLSDRNVAKYGDKFENNIIDGKFGLVWAMGTNVAFPYISAGINYPLSYSKTTVQKKDLVKSKLAWYGEIGLKFLLSDMFSLNLSGTFNSTGTDYADGVEKHPSGTDFNDMYGTFQVGLGLVLGLAKDSDGDGVKDDVDQCPNTPKGVMVDEFGCPIDSDRDGVPDYLDKCPDTPTGVKVDSDGCPLDSDGDGVPDYLDKCPDTPTGVKVDVNGCPLDSDGDGVYDYLDKCPNTPKGVKVDKNGCPLDSDGDGVPDYLDKCPDTPKGTKVTSDGCPIKEELMSVCVYFGFDKSVLTKEAKKTLDNVIKYMGDNSDVMFSLQGHTCSIGPDGYNMKLSERRAKSVFNYMVSKGIDKKRLETKWFGETQPAHDNKTREGRKLNRRTCVIELRD